MINYSFIETLDFFCQKLNAFPPVEDLESGEVELVIDSLYVILSEGKLKGSLHMQVLLGILLQPLSEEKLKELATSNFLGVNIGGCKLAFDEKGVSLCLHCYTSCGTPPQESWEWLHRLLCMAQEWNKVLLLWNEFIPLNTPSGKKNELVEKNNTYRV